MQLSDFDYHLPEELIAQHPPAERGQSRLLVVGEGRFEDCRFPSLPDFLLPGDLLVFNDTRVIKARLFGYKETGGKVEVLVERVLNDHEVHAFVRASKSPGAGTRLTLADRWPATVLGRDDDVFHLHFDTEETVWQVLEESGRLPLPPYIVHNPTEDDDNRYQTVYAKVQGAVAAPTAGLHFTDTLLAQLSAQGIGQAFVTLHVGAGTFQPVRVENLAEHRMHTERFEVPQATIDAIAATRARGGRVTAVGTTSLRALESAARSGELSTGWQETDLFITPGYRFRVVDLLVTNFHLPKSTLLMLVSAFAGYPVMRAAYDHAVQEKYRFFSYGDAMLLTRDDRVSAW